jgi:DNA-binding transcriptional regulator GbsR (MarR family)
MPKHDPQAQFIESLALQLSSMGLQRMAARAFAALLCADGGSMTARELAERLGASAAAISGALKYLTQFGIVARDRRPGERVDHYSVGPDSWGAAIEAETNGYEGLIGVLEKGVREVPFSEEAAARVAETRDFFVFVSGELPRLMDRWHASRS